VAAIVKPFEALFCLFLLLYHPTLVLIILYSAHAGTIHQGASFSPHVPLSHAGPVPLFGRRLTNSCPCWAPLSPRALHVLCAAGFVTRGGFSPPTTFYPCRRCGRQAPKPVCALRRLEKHRGERPPLPHGSACEPGSITRRSHQHTAYPICTRVRHALGTVRSVPPAQMWDLRPSRRGVAVFRTAPSGRTPVLPKRQSALKSLRARATIPRVRSRALPAPHRCSYHCDRALSGWQRRQAQAISMALARICRLPAVAIPSARRDWPL